MVAVSAGGGSVETLDAVARYHGACPIVALTNTEGSAIASAATSVIPMLADVERSGVACRSFQHTLALWLALEARLLGGIDVPALLDASAIATGDLIAREGEWLPRLTAERHRPAGHPLRGAGPAAELGPAGSADASGDPAAARGRLRDR